MRKTGRKWKTEKCARCGNTHNGYSGKMDNTKIEYVICGETNKRMNVLGKDQVDFPENSWYTEWVEEKH